MKLVSFIVIHVSLCESGAASTSTSPHSYLVHQTGITSPHAPPPESTLVPPLPSSSHGKTDYGSIALRLVLEVNLLIIVVIFSSC